MSEALGPKQIRSDASRLWRWVPMRLAVIPLAFAVMALVWVASRIFPGIRPATLALVAAFAVAIVVAFGNWGPLGRRRRRGGR